MEKMTTSNCIDEYFTKLEFPGPLVPLKNDKGRWELAMEPSVVDDKVTFYACLPSEPIKNVQPDRKTPSLFVICGVNVIDVAAIVISDYGVQKDMTVLLRFDENESETTTWRLTPDKKAIIAPITGGLFTRKLMKNSELFIQMTLNKKQFEFSYYLQGTSDALKTLHQACKWE